MEPDGGNGARLGSIRREALGEGGEGNSECIHCVRNIVEGMGCTILYKVDEISQL